MFTVVLLRTHKMTWYTRKLQPKSADRAWIAVHHGSNASDQCEEDWKNVSTQMILTFSSSCDISSFACMQFNFYIIFSIFFHFWEEQYDFHADEW